MTDNTVAAQLERVRTENARLKLQIEHLTNRFELYKEHVDAKFDLYAQHLEPEEDE